MKNLVPPVKFVITHKKHTSLWLDSLCIAFALLVSLMDYISGYDISFFPFYLLPVLVASWSGRKWSGPVVALLCGVLWGAVHWSLGQYLSLHTLAWNTSTRIAVFLLFAYLARETQKTMLRLHAESTLARMDPLTGVMNYRSLHEAAEMELKRLERHQRPLTLVYLDIDNFKTVNDTAGHTAGDNLLCTIAGVIKGNIRSVDMLGRLGGDEFAILLPETGPEMAKSFTRKIREILLNDTGISRYPVTFSFGVATFMTSPASVDDMVRIGDETMYRVKNSGKNNIEYRLYE
jgi:diguanylate cyclase (GGDEF)-like protein